MSDAVGFEGTEILLELESFPQTKAKAPAPNGPVITEQIIELLRLIEKVGYGKSLKILQSVL